MASLALSRAITTIGFSSLTLRFLHSGAAGITFVRKQNLNQLASFSTSQTVEANKPGVGKLANSALDPDKIKGPGGLTMTQIGKLVQESRARDLEHQKKQQQQQSSSPKRK
ncbi:hypothetical protein CPC16_003671 [Podila verticillata]|nr:hypothetical protein BGZ59_002771 [Podila verticillata]KAF9392027.1 hypothetical protein CPC16_003671 [Podila verticillata]KAI9235247.1 MAG: hypothetical protein BYD32DRAFT_463631 [Podila humilis]KFH70708.1 hypothetical protein MVEG_03556 [Podila verticillata NRRL 6337]